MIITVTLNAAIDKSLAVPNFRLGRRHRTVEQRTMAGGKGVNIARTLKALGQPVIATGFAGGATGTHIVEQLTEESILNDFVRIRDESRTNTSVLDPTTGEQTEINERGPAVSDHEVELFRDKLKYLARGADIVVFAGSLPRGVDADLYARLIRDLERLDVLTALGVKIDLEPRAISRCIKEAGIGFMFAPSHHPAMKHVGPTRIELGTRTIFNLLGPLSNPAGVKRQMVGVFARPWIEPLAKVLAALGSERAWVVHGSDGLDEVTTSGPTFVAELDQGKVKTFEITPESNPEISAGDSR